MTKSNKPADRAKQVLKALDREDALEYAIKKLNEHNKSSGDIFDIEAASYWREVVVQILAY